MTIYKYVVRSSDNGIIGTYDHDQALDILDTNSVYLFDDQKLTVLEDGSLDLDQCKADNRYWEILDFWKYSGSSPREPLNCDFRGTTETFDLDDESLYFRGNWGVDMVLTVPTTPNTVFWEATADGQAGNFIRITTTGSTGVTVLFDHADLTTDRSISLDANSKAGLSCRILASFRTDSVSVYAKFTDGTYGGGTLPNVSYPDIQNAFSITISDTNVIAHKWLDKPFSPGELTAGVLSQLNILGLSDNITKEGNALVVGNKYEWLRTDDLPSWLLPLNGGVYGNADVDYPELWSVRVESALVASFSDANKTINLQNYNGDALIEQAGAIAGQRGSIGGTGGSSINTVRSIWCVITKSQGGLGSPPIPTGDLSTPDSTTYPTTIGVSDFVTEKIAEATAAINAKVDIEYVAAETQTQDKWINDKPIFRQIVNDVTLNQNGTTTLLTNVDDIVSENLQVIYPNGLKISIPYRDGNGGFYIYRNSDGNYLASHDRTDFTVGTFIRGLISYTKI